MVSVDDLIKKVERLFEEEKYEEIIDELNGVLEEYDSAILYAWKARAYNRLDSPIALEYADKAIQLDERVPLAYLARGNAWIELNEFRKAIKDYDIAIQLDSKYVIAYYNRSSVWFILKEFDKSLADLNRVIEFDPNYLLAYNGRGVVWYNLKNYQNALADCTHAIKLDPLYASAYSNRANVWFDLANYDKALIDSNQAIDIDPSVADFFYNRALTHKNLGNLEKAINDFTSYIDLTSDKNDFWAQQAREYIKELKRKTIDEDYKKISNVVENIKLLLLFKADRVTHYTTLSTAKILLLNKEKNSRFRISEGAFLNDTAEGRELFKFLDFHTSKKSEDEISEPFLEKPFIGSFVAESKHNDLALWRMYGKEESIEASGCALTINRQKFIQSIQDLIQKDKKDNLSIDNEFTFYRVAYISKNGTANFIVPDSEVDETKFEQLMEDLKKVVRKVNRSKKTDVPRKLKIAEKLNEIAYLLKC